MDLNVHPNTVCRCVYYKYKGHVLRMSGLSAVYVNLDAPGNVLLPNQL